MHHPEFTLDIVHCESHRKIVLRYPAATRLVWKKVAAKTRAHTRLPEVKRVLSEFPMSAKEWAIAQAALDRLAKDRPYQHLSVDEAQHAMNLILATLLYSHGKGKRWKLSRAFLILMADITPYLLSPLAPVSDWGKADANDSAVKIYEHLRSVIGHSPSWFSLNKIYVFWYELAHYKGTNKGVLQLEKRLNALCKPYRLVLKKIN